MTCEWPGCDGDAEYRSAYCADHQVDLPRHREPDDAVVALAAMVIVLMMVALSALELVGAI